jgi:hypothetical protein
MGLIPTLEWGRSVSASAWDLVRTGKGACGCDHIKVQSRFCLRYVHPDEPLIHGAFTCLSLT